MTEKKARMFRVYALLEWDEVYESDVFAKSAGEALKTFSSLYPEGQVIAVLDPHLTEAQKSTLRHKILEAVRQDA